MSDSIQFAQARDQLHVWKPNPLRDYSVAFVKAGLALLDKGIGHFGSDDVPEDVSPGGGIPGSAVESLRNAKVIRDCWLTLPDEGLFGGRRRSKRESANGRKCPVYTLASREMALSFLERNGCNVPRGQLEMRM